VSRTPYALRRLFDTVAGYPIRELNDLAARHTLAPLSDRYLPWNPVAMRPAGLVAVLNDICINGSSTIVECGGGISTLYIGRLLRQLGRGHLHTVEHHRGWAAQLREQVRAENLGDHVTVLVAELVPTTMTLDGGEALWYDTAALEPVIRGARIDLLLVDGPPAGPGPRALARYPAVPFLGDHLAARYTIVLDDVYRQGEQLVLDAWERLLGVPFQRRFNDGRIAIGRSEESFQA
jgi:hypothetical protein